MTKKIYEYKDEQDWYVAQWSESGALSFSFDEAEEIYNLLYTIQLLAGDQAGVQIQVIRHQSDLRLIQFMLEIINEEQGRKLELQVRAGALLVVENGQLLYVHVPKSGVNLERFLGQGAEKETILIATRNEGKTKEFEAIFRPLGYQVENLNKYPDLPEVEETGLTFEENARLKAETISSITGKMVLADDSGLKVDILGGLPGVWSARFSGPDATDATNNQKLLHELAMVFDKEKRSAQFHCCLVLAAPERESLVVEADWAGYIATEAKGEHGFGYDPLFLVGEGDKTSAQLTMEEKNQISHRALALKKLMEVFPTWMNQ